MNIKSFLITAISAFALVACSPDSSTSPLEAYSTVSSSSNQDVSSSSVLVIQENLNMDNQTPGSSSDFSLPQSFSKNECSVKQLSDNSAEIIMTMAGMNSNKMTMTLVGSMVELESVTTYDASVSDANVKKICDESKEEAAVAGQTVTCDTRSITVKMKESANGKSIADVISSSNEMCEQMNKTLNPDKPIDNPVKNPDTSTTNPAQNKKATCEVITDTETAFKMVIVAPDSLTLTVDASYKNELFVMKAIGEFMPNITQSQLDKECAEAKAEAAAEDEMTTSVTCEGNVITETMSAETPMNPMPVIATTFIGQCDKIQETGVIPDDD